MALLLIYGWWFTNPYRTAKGNAFHLFWLRLSEAKPRQALDNDNIYTVSTSPTAGDPVGIPPTFGSQPANRKDSLLVNDLPAPRK
jgi:hypothetical protein